MTDSNHIYNSIAIRLALLVFILSFAVVFCFTDPKELLKNIGSAVILLLSLIEAVRMLERPLRRLSEMPSRPDMKSATARSCVRCGKENPDEAEFCMYCGAVVSEETQNASGGNPNDGK